MIKIPLQNRWFQSNRGSIFGSIWSSFNLNLSAEKDRGRGFVRTTRMLRGATSATLANLGVPVAFRTFDDVAYAIAGTRVFRQGNAHTSPWAEVTTSGVPTNLTADHSDMEVFNGKLWISEGTNENVRGVTAADVWNTVDWGTMGTSKPHMLTVYAQRLYMSGVVSGDSVIRSMDTAETVAALGASNTVTIGEEFASKITFLRSVSNGIWIGTVNTRGGKGRVYFWDGAQSSGVNASYRLQSTGALAGIVKDDVLYIVDTDGKLMAFNGGTFVELDRLPLKENYLNFAIGDDNARWIHPNGMTVADDRILFLIQNDYDSGTIADTIEENVPSGIWEWSKETGLYHKYGLSNTPLSGSGGGTIVDYGQNRIGVAGALAFIKQDDEPTNENGSLFAGARIYTDATSLIYGIFIDDLNDTVQKYGYLVTPKIFSQNITDTWQKVFARMRRLVTSTDSITVKYRTSEADPVEATITWVDTDTFTVTAADVPDLAAGDEVEVVQGDGSGKCAHVSSFTGTTTLTVNLDDTFTGITTNTAIARFQKWKKIATVTSQNDDFFQFPIGEVGVWVQLKICMQHTGADELYDLVLVNERKDPAK